MSVTPLISQEPCWSCDHAATEGDTGAFYCRSTPFGDAECETFLAVLRVSERAAQVAAIVARETNQRLRSEEADSVAAAYDKVVSELGGSFDYVAFMRACSASSDCARCRTRRVTDAHDGACGACEWGVAA